MKYMYGLTGHTQGIGEKLFQLLNSNVIGFSRSNGFDVYQKEGRKRIIEASLNCDVFINNAPAGFSQTYLFLDLIKVWKDFSDKKIINVGSQIAELELPVERLDLLNYQAEKLALKEMSYRVASIVKCQIFYKSFGYVGTKKILEKYPHFTESDYISLDKACEIILN